MKEVYEPVEMEVVEFENEDVIRTSGEQEDEDELPMAWLIEIIHIITHAAPPNLRGCCGIGGIMNGICKIVGCSMEIHSLFQDVYLLCCGYQAEQEEMCQL